MTAFAEYAQKDKTVRMERRNGILQLTLHTEGKALRWGVLRHSEVPLLCDIVLAAEQASFQDAGHFGGGLVPGDGVHAVYPLPLKRQMQDLLGYGLALEGMALMEKPLPPQAG